jgi:hypothetical protein
MLAVAAALVPIPIPVPVQVPGYASKLSGGVQSVELRSEAGSLARVRNPWGNQTVTLTRNGKRWQQLKGSLLTFETDPGDVVSIRPT